MIDHKHLFIYIIIRDWNNDGEKFCALMDKERKTKKEKRLVQRVKSYMERKYKWVLEATKEEVLSNMITIPMEEGDLLFFRSDLFHYGPKKKENDRYVLIHLCIYLYISIYFIINICIYIYI